MAEVDWSGSTLLRYFSEFYSEVAQCKAAIASGGLQQLFEGELPAQPNPDELAGAVSRRLLRCLQRQQREVAAKKAEAQRLYRLAQYAMAALADEIFILEVEWPGCEHWLRHLLELALFQRNQAGRGFFHQLAHLLREPSHGTYRELAVVYLLALQLGFKGEHRGTSGRVALAECRTRLLAFIAGRRPAPTTDERAFAQAYDYTLAQHPAQRLAPLKPWYRAGGVALAAYFLASAAIWFSFVLPATQHLQQLTGQGG